MIMNVPNLYQKVYEIVKQIPKGKVSTYKQIAIALGDPIAARAVGRALNANEDPETIPCYRVVHSNGKIGDYSLGKEEKIKRLKEDGIKIVDERIVNFDEVFFSNFKTDYPLMKLRKEQEELREKVKIVRPKLPNSLRVAGVDVSYNGRKAKAAIVIMDSNFNVLKEKTAVCNVTFPYIPTYLSYREAPIFLKLIESISNETISGKNDSTKTDNETLSTNDIGFDVLLVDGNGILHPRRFGIASHVGVLLNKPTIGVAKSLLFGKVKDDIVYDDNKAIGAEIRFNSKPIYISPGHLIDLETSIKIVKRFTKKYEPEVLKMAHKLAKLICSK